MKKLRCLLGLHNWVETVTEGERYLTCRNCGKYADNARAMVGYPTKRW